MAFVTLSACQLFHSFNVKSHESIFSKQVFNNKYLWLAALVGAGLQIAIINIPILADLFKLVPLSIPNLMIAIGFAGMTIVIVEIYKFIIRIFKKKQKEPLMVLFTCNFYGISIKSL